MKKYVITCAVLIVFLWCFHGNIANASNMNTAKVSISPDGKAFTTNAGEKATKWYQKDYVVKTGVVGDLRQPQTGEHLYKQEREDMVPVKEWKVVLSRSVCQHDIYPAGNWYHGVSFGRKKCLKEYYSGWYAYCADCNEPIIDKFFYMSEEVAKSIHYLDMSKSYYYKCPHCDNLEQAVTLKVHVCNKVSKNRYYVRYHANLGNGYMEKSVHMVNNATEYEGRQVTPQKNLNLNTYYRQGYEFTGWNTKKDGSGTYYADGAEIFNLSMTENDSVILYAQWKKSESVLEIHPNGGSYLGKTGIQKIAGDYGTEYQVQTSKLIAPKGYTIHFDTMGGEAIADKVGTRTFQEWSCSQPFQGSLNNDIYIYMGSNGNVDRITAIYQLEPVILPLAKRSGYSFGGWFADKECTIPIGNAGDRLVPSKETTVYALWVDLKLTAKDNYVDNQGKGAVNLSWTQKDNKNKVYEIYQRKEKESWINVKSLEEKVDDFRISKKIPYTGKTGTYTIPYTGFYTLTLWGAQGQDFGTNHGGKGGMVQATIYLEKGEKLEYSIGGQKGFSDGGKGNIYGNGGGLTKVSTKKQGTILIAGGGGGATSVEDGGVGGSASGVLQSPTGETGDAGGGGGYQGGVCGTVEIHKHSEKCCHVHVGNPKTKGGCYTIPTECGSNDIEFQFTHTTFYYGNLTEDGKLQYCVRCASYECPGHLDEHGVYLCKNCGNRVDYYIEKCSAIKVYALSCDRDESYVCGRKEGEIVKSSPALGGLSYVKKEVCMDYTEKPGVQSGDGALQIESKQIGVQENKELKGVIATDEAGPCMIAENKVVITAVDEKKVRVAFNKPEDRGTSYYHQVKSYDKTHGQFLCESNVTKNTLISGVVGYRYVLDENSKTLVKHSHSYMKESGDNPFLMVDIDDKDKYLHIAAEDKAGNLGETIHIRINSKEVVYWPLITEKLILKDGDNIAYAGTDDTYFVRADGATPIQLTLEGVLCGTARKTYQINEAEFLVWNKAEETDEGIFAVLVPNREIIQAGTFTYPMDMLQKRLTGKVGMEDASYTLAKRYNKCKNLILEQKFLVPQNLDSCTLQIIPTVIAEGEDKTVYSQRNRDMLNGIYLIPDGKSPEIMGAEQLKNPDLTKEWKNETKKLLFSAKDEGSGLASFYVEVRNEDNGLIKCYEDTDLTGSIYVTLDKKESIFSGKFNIIVYAEDAVGNESILQSELLSIGLEASVKRILEPHTPVFKKGESGILYVKTWGYVDKLEIYFPDDFVKEDSSLKRTIVYKRPDYQKTEEIMFMVPFTALEGEKTIEVKAYKGGKLLEDTPGFITLKVEGSVLDELRTRLR